MEALINSFFVVVKKKKQELLFLKLKISCIKKLLNLILFGNFTCVTLMRCINSLTFNGHHLILSSEVLNLFSEFLVVKLQY